MATIQAAVPATQQTWNIDPTHSEAGFAVKHLMISTVKGTFRELSGSVQLDASDLTNSKVAADIVVASIDTRQEQRDNHLRSGDFFDAENYPVITFRSTDVAVRDDDEFRVTGDLTIRGVTRQVVLNVEETGRGKDPWGGERIGYAATTKIDRTDFGLTWNAALETGGGVVSNEIKISIDVEVVLA